MFNLDCLICGLLSYPWCLGWVYLLFKRGDLRDRFNIPGASLEDCCTVYWCPCCAAIQNETEAVKRLPAPVTNTANVVTDQPQAQPAMNMTPSAAQ
ncbi:PLAC8 family-domain-containing protein [Xylariomycetidae sp. FL2044]|nr:PLAC8 family-domain-containing protein [Xylariomycetidae sp. FL2044]